MVHNKQLIYVTQPTDAIRESEHIQVRDSEFDLYQSPPEGAITVKVHYVSFDPYMRGRMKPADRDDYVPVYQLGEPMNNFGIATVIKSSNSDYREGDIVWEPGCTIAQYAVITKDVLQLGRKLENPYKIPLTNFLSALGLAGLTAYSSLYAIGKPKRGETIFISAASGAVGQIVGQISRQEGLRVIGSVGDDKKLDFIKSLGFEGFNYKREKPANALARLAPDGIDIYYENVGGEHLEAAIDALKVRGRIVGCGQIGEYNKALEERYGIKNTYLLVKKRILMQGFIVTDEDMGGKYGEEHLERMQKWIADGDFEVKEEIYKGVENAPKAMLDMYSGKSFGKVILEINPLNSA